MRTTPMSAIVIEHVKVSDLPEPWQAKLTAPQDARVTVRIEEELKAIAEPAIQETETAFGMWRDRADMVDVEDYLRKLRTPRYMRA